MKFRKKPVVIEAIQFKNTVNSMNEIEQFVGGDLGRNDKGQLVISTLEGAMICSINDWIIKGVNGEFYPCKPDIFEKSYEPADQPTQKSCEGCEHHYHSFPTKEKHPCYNCNDFSNYQPK